jgi:hypothetical protein
MVILQTFGNYAQPRKHLTKAKLFHIIDGEMVVVVFEQDGKVRAVHHLAVDKVIVIHIDSNCYHTNMALTPQAIYHEVIIGPFERGSTDRVFAAFAPSEGEQIRGLEYIREAVESLHPDVRIG